MYTFKQKKATQYIVDLHIKGVVIYFKKKNTERTETF